MSAESPGKREQNKQAKVLYWQIRLLLRPFLAPWIPLWVQRFWSEFTALSTKGPSGLRSVELEMGGVGGVELTSHDTRPDRVLLYLHGGAYVLGGPASHSKLAAQVGYAAGATVYLPDYRLAPEHPFPAALDDSLAAYRWLLKRGAQCIAIAGDSAGGGLAVATAMAIRDAKLPPPAALALISPWVDLTLSGESHQTRARRDPMLRTAWLKFAVERYAYRLPQNEPLISPLFGSLTNLPPMLIQVGSEEILLSDSEVLAKRARAAGVHVQFKCYEGMWHVFQANAGSLPESDQALTEIGAFLYARIRP